MTQPKTLSLILLTFALACTGYVDGEDRFEHYPDEEGYEDFEGEPEYDEEEHDHDHELDDDVSLAVTGAISYSCEERSDTGYSRGTPTPITVVTVDGEPMEKNTANAFLEMAEAASNAGVRIRVISGFRTMDEQRDLYSCYIHQNCNNGNLAARPGYSRHQSGTALDLNTRNRSVFNWLTSNGGRYGFRRTVPSEPWHWVYGGGPIDGGACPSGPPPATPRGCGILNEDRSLARGAALRSCNGRYSLQHQTDGNVVLYDLQDNNRVLFATWTQGQATSALWMQTDGNLVLYSGDSRALWYSGTNADGESFLSVQNDGNLVLYNEYHRPLWTRHDG